MTTCFCCGSNTMLPATAAKSPNTMSSTSSSFIDRSPVNLLRPRKVPSRVFRVSASAAVDSYGSSPDFIKRMEQAWLISKQPRPVACSSCDSNGHVECKWCGGTGFFILGDNMLCQVPSRNTGCVICTGNGSMRCRDCKGTGFRAKWLGEPPIPHPSNG
ncbi:unnamed protein product [Linum trigynum]|uniref:Uncharacterized protein n=1 Tax=Linum trigynum TaxID=586398 RepID=A0AAV2C9G5_9ROSI